MNANGTVVVEVQVDTQGKVSKVTPISGPSVFYQEAINAVMGWRFKPATLGGINTASSPQISLVFKAPN
jgi:TonB family protein